MLMKQIIYHLEMMNNIQKVDDRVNKKRAEIEKTVYDVMNLLDKSGYNANFYKEFFGKMRMKYCK